jgi:hypothetical protein
MAHLSLSLSHIKVRSPSIVVIVFITVHEMMAMVNFSGADKRAKRPTSIISAQVCVDPPPGLVVGLTND